MPRFRIVLNCVGASPDVAEWAAIRVCAGRQSLVQARAELRRDYAHPGQAHVPASYVDGLVERLDWLVSVGIAATTDPAAVCRPPRFAPEQEETPC